MIAGKTVLGIVTARGGSKRLPGKNLKNLAGKPLISWTIEAGLNSRYVDEVMVTTDDLEISVVAGTCGAKVPFIRPSELSGDNAASVDVLQHTVKFYWENLQKEFDYILLLQPTSPLRDSVEIDGALELLASKQADAVISVSEMEHSPLWSNTLPKSLSMVDFLPEEMSNKRSQDLDKYYRINGAIYICETKRFLQENTLFLRDNIFAYIMPAEKSPDIDTELDLKLCQFLLERRSIS